MKSEITKIFNLVKDMNYYLPDNCILTYDKVILEIRYRGKNIWCGNDDETGLYNLYEWLHEHYRNDLKEISGVRDE